MPTLIEKLLYDKSILNLCGMVTPMLLLDPTTLETAAEQRVTLYGIKGSDRSLLLPDLDPELFISFIQIDRQTQAVKNYRQSLQHSDN